VATQLRLGLFFEAVLTGLQVYFFDIHSGGIVHWY